MVSKKVCMLGAFSVGKTSLVERYVHSIFSDTYLSTIGVKISKKTMPLGGRTVTLVLWDMEGKDDFTSVNLSYLRGAAGIMLVADGMRAETLDTALSLRSLVFSQFGTVPHRLVVNKADLAHKWEIQQDDLTTLEHQGLCVSVTSARTGQGVESMFHSLTHTMCRELL